MGMDVDRSTTSLKRSASAISDPDGENGVGSVKRVRASMGNSELATAAGQTVPEPVTRTVQFALKREPSTSGEPAAHVQTELVGESAKSGANAHPNANSNAESVFRAALLAKLAEESSASASASSAPSSASTAPEPLPPVHPQHHQSQHQTDQDEEDEDEEEEEEEDDPYAERSDGGWDDEEEWVPPSMSASVSVSVAPRSSVSVAPDTVAVAALRSLMSPPPTPTPVPGPGSVRADANMESSSMSSLPPVAPAPTTVTAPDLKLITPSGPEPTPAPPETTSPVAATIPTALPATAEGRVVVDSALLAAASPETAADPPAVDSAPPTVVAAFSEDHTPAAFTSPAAAAAFSEDHTPATAPATAEDDVDDDWLEAVAPSNFTLPEDAFWTPASPPVIAGGSSPLSLPTAPSPPPGIAALPAAVLPMASTLIGGQHSRGTDAFMDGQRSRAMDAAYTQHPSTTDAPSELSYHDSGDEQNHPHATGTAMAVQVAPGFAMRGHDGAKVQCARCGKWMAPEATAGHVARICGTIPDPNRRKTKAPRRSSATNGDRTEYTPRARKEKKPKPSSTPLLPVAPPSDDRWIAQWDAQRGILCAGCGTWVELGAGGAALGRWSGRTGHKSVCRSVVEVERREAAEARMLALTHANEPPAPVPPALLADTRVRRIDGDQAQCDLCGTWTLFKNWDAHHAVRCGPIRARQEARRAQRGSTRAAARAAHVAAGGAGADYAAAELSDLTSASECESDGGALTARRPGAGGKVAGAVKTPAAAAGDASASAVSVTGTAPDGKAMAASVKPIAAANAASTSTTTTGKTTPATTVKTTPATTGLKTNPAPAGVMKPATVATAVKPATVATAVKPATAALAVKPTTATAAVKASAATTNTTTTTAKTTAAATVAKAGAAATVAKAGASAAAPAVATVKQVATATASAVKSSSAVASGSGPTSAPATAPAASAARVPRGPMKLGPYRMGGVLMGPWPPGVRMAPAVPKAAAASGSASAAPASKPAAPTGSAKTATASGPAKAATASGSAIAYGSAKATTASGSAKATAAGSTKVTTAGPSSTGAAARSAPTTTATGSVSAKAATGAVSAAAATATGSTSNSATLGSTSAAASVSASTSAAPKNRAPRHQLCKKRSGPVRHGWNEPAAGSSKKPVGRPSKKQKKRTPTPESDSGSGPEEPRWPLIVPSGWILKQRWKKEYKEAAAAAAAIAAAKASSGSFAAAMAAMAGPSAAPAAPAGPSPAVTAPSSASVAPASGDRPPAPAAIVPSKLSAPRSTAVAAVPTPPPAGKKTTARAVLPLAPSVSSSSAPVPVAGVKRPADPTTSPSSPTKKKKVASLESILSDAEARRAADLATASASNSVPAPVPVPARPTFHKAKPPPAARVASVASSSQTPAHAAPANAKAEPGPSTAGPSQDAHIKRWVDVGPRPDEPHRKNICGIWATVSRGERHIEYGDDVLPDDPAQMLRYERQVLLTYDPDVARVGDDNTVQCKGCMSWIKLRPNYVAAKKWYGRTGHKACCHSNIERRKSGVKSDVGDITFGKPFRIRKIKGDKLQCDGCGKTVTCPMWERHLDDRCPFYTLPPSTPKVESSDSDSEAFESWMSAQAASNSGTQVPLDVAIAKRRAKLLEDDTVRELGENKVLCDLCGRWVKISAHMYADHKWYGDQGHRKRCLAQHPGWKPSLAKAEPPSSPATSIPPSPAKSAAPGTSTALNPLIISLRRSPAKSSNPVPVPVPAPAPAPASQPDVIEIPETSSDHEGSEDDDDDYDPEEDERGGNESASSEDPVLDI